MNDHEEFTQQEIKIEPLKVCGTLSLPCKNPSEYIIFAHGSGSSRFNPRNRYVAEILNRAGFATLLMDLLTPDEEETEQFSGHLRFNIGFLSDRLTGAADWLEVFCSAHLNDIKIGYFGASTGAAAAIVAAVRRPGKVHAIVSRSGRPDLAGNLLQELKTPSLFIVGEKDTPVIPLNEAAFEKLTAEKEMAVIPGASHLFEEPGALEKVAELAAAWFEKYLKNPAQSGEPLVPRD